MKLGFWIAAVFFYIPLAILFVMLEWTEQIQLGHYMWCVSIPIFFLTVVIGGIIDRR